jgi:hypothetical protein
MILLTALVMVHASTRRFSEYQFSMHETHANVSNGRMKKHNKAFRCNQSDQNSQRRANGAAPMLHVPQAAMPQCLHGASVMLQGVGISSSRLSLDMSRGMSSGELEELNPGLLHFR